MLWAKGKQDQVNLRENKRYFYRKTVDTLQQCWDHSVWREDHKTFCKGQQRNRGGPWPLLLPGHGGQRPGRTLLLHDSGGEKYIFSFFWWYFSPFLQNSQQNFDCIAVCNSAPGLQTWASVSVPGVLAILARHRLFMWPGRLLMGKSVCLL